MDGSSGKHERLFILIVGLLILFLSAGLLGRYLGMDDELSPMSIISTAFVSPFLTGGLVGWMARKGGASLSFFLFLLTVPFFGFLAMMGLAGLGSGWLPVDWLALLGLLLFTVSWALFLPLGGMLGERLYKKLHKS